MAHGMDWFRWHHGSVTDPKFALVARKAGASLPDVLAVWAYLLERASSAEQRGNFGEIDCEAVDCLFNFADGRTADILAAMGARDLIAAGGVVAWEKRQPKREREGDNSTERSRLSRQRQKEQEEAMQRHATPCNASDSQETPRGEEKREEISTSLRSVESASKRATRKCPEAFQLTEELTKWAREKFPAVNAGAEFEKFRDHTFKTPISDWAGAFRNWVRRSPDMGRQMPLAPATSAAPSDAATREMLDRQSAVIPDPELARKAREALQQRRLTA